MTPEEVNWRKIYSQVLENEGITMNTDGSEYTPKRGYQVGVGEEVKMAYSGLRFNPILASDLKRFFFAKRQEVIDSDILTHIGFWVSGNYVVGDTTRHVRFLPDAMELGREQKQKAIWDWKNTKEIKVI